MTDLIDFFSKHELFLWFIVIAYIAFREFQHQMAKVSQQLAFTNRYLLLLCQRQYSNKEILEETSDLKPEPGFWSSLFK